MVGQYWVFERVYFVFILIGKLSAQLEKKEEVNQEILPLLFEAVSVNSNYTSKIEVRLIIEIIYSILKMFK